MTVKQTGERVEVEIKISGPQDRTLNDSYMLNGKPAEFTPAMIGGGQAKKGTRTATASADGSSMEVIEEAEVETPEGFDKIKGKRTWRLSDGGKVLTIELDLAGEKAAPIKGKRVYQKQ